MGIRGIYTGVCLECERSGLLQTELSELAIWPLDLIESELRVNYLAKLEVLSYNAPAGVTL